MAHDITWLIFFWSVDNTWKTPNITFESTKSHLWSESQRYHKCWIASGTSLAVNSSHICGRFDSCSMGWQPCNSWDVWRKENHPLVLLHTSFSHVWMMRKIWWRFLHLFTMFDVELGHRPPALMTLAGRPLWKWAVPLLRSTDHLHFRVPSCPVLMGTQSPQTYFF